jgi:hypothetical protein
MRREVTDALVAEAAYLAAYPPVTFRGDVLGDEGAWRYTIARASEAELVELLVALGPSLLQVTPGGTSRLHWYQTHQLPDIDAEPLLVGDVEAEALVKAALALVPPVVRFVIQRECVFIACGRSSLAFTCSSRFVDNTGAGRPLMIVMSGECDELLLLHEMAHAFTCRIPHEHSQALSAIGERDFRMLARAEGWEHRIDYKERFDEVLADALALCWAFGPLAGKTS